MKGVYILEVGDSGNYQKQRHVLRDVNRRRVSHVLGHSGCFGYGSGKFSEPTVAFANLLRYSISNRRVDVMMMKGTPQRRKVVAIG